MALKFTLASKAELDALPEGVRALYVERDGKYVLDADDSDIKDLKTKLAEFRDNNRTLHAELEKLRPLAQKFEGIDPDEYRDLKAEVTKLKKKGVDRPEDIDALIKTSVENALKPVQQELEKERKIREEAQRAADEGKFKELLTADANKAGIAATAMRHVLRDAKDFFELKDGKLVPREGVKHPSDPLKEMTTDAWFGTLAKSDPYLFEANVGGGAGGNGRRGGAENGGLGQRKPNARQLINPTPEEMGQHVDAIAKGDMVVVRT